MNQLTIPRQIKLRGRFGGPAEAFHAKLVESLYIIGYFKLIYVPVQQLDGRLLKCPGLLTY